MHEDARDRHLRIASWNRVKCLKIWNLLAKEIRYELMGRSK